MVFANAMASHGIRKTIFTFSAVMITDLFKKVNMEDKEMSCTLDFSYK